MKKLSLGKLKLLPEEVLQRGQMGMIHGGSGIGIGGCIITCRGPNGDEHQHDVPVCSVGCIQGAGYVAVQCVGPPRCHY